MELHHMVLLLLLLLPLLLLPFHSSYYPTVFQIGHSVLPPHPLHTAYVLRVGVPSTLRSIQP
jgi:hypothetical protein